MKLRQTVRRWTTALLVAGPLLVALVNCGGPSSPAIVDLSDGHEISDYRLLSVSGSRDGDRLPVEIVLEGPHGSLSLKLQFQVGVPTRLESGRYEWTRDSGTLQGTVQERAVTFLGGQSDRPNLGGAFELRSESGKPQFRVTIPTSPVTKPEVRVRPSRR